MREHEHTLQFRQIYLIKHVYPVLVNIGLKYLQLLNNLEDNYGYGISQHIIQFTQYKDNNKRSAQQLITSDPHLTSEN